MKERAVDFVGKDGDVVFSGNVDERGEQGGRQDGASGVIGIAVTMLVRFYTGVGELEQYLIIISLVFGFIRALSSSISGIHLFSGFAFHKSTSAPSAAGTEYNC